MSNGTEESRALVTMPVAVQTRAAAVSIQEAEAMLPAVQAIWPKDLAANTTLQKAIARIAVAYGLDPLMNEITVYQGKPYITIDGRMRKAQDNPLYQGLEARPATEEERRAYRALEADHLWRCEAYRSDWKKPDGSLRPAIGWGLVRKGAHEKNFIANSTPELIAEKRAKARALRDLFNIPLPSAEEEEGWDASPQRYITADGEITDTRPGGMLAAQGHLAAIHLLCKRLQISEGQRHEQLQSMFGKTATNELTEGEAAAYLEFLGALAAERLAGDPEIIEMQAREAAYTAPPRAASKRFHAARPEPQPAAGRTQAASVAEEIPQAEDPAGDDDLEDGTVPGESASPGESEDPEAPVPEEIMAPLLRVRKAYARGQELPWNDDPKKRAGPGKACVDRLRLHDYTPAESAALFKALHLVTTGEETPLLEAGKVISARYLVALQELPTPDVEELLPAARWFLAREERRAQS